MKNCPFCGSVMPRGQRISLGDICPSCGCELGLDDRLIVDSVGAEKNFGSDPRANVGTRSMLAHNRRTELAEGRVAKRAFQK